MRRDKAAFSTAFSHSCKRCRRKFSRSAVYGIQWTSPCFYIQDQPRFAWRGMMLDVSRHFVDKQEVERILDGLALHKLNIFHWHLTDDHGWRIEIKSYPLLTATASTNTAAWRTGIDYGQNPAASTAFNSFGKYGGYYTQDDIREVVAYAQQRHITIVPELEFPAHCTAALVSYPNFGCGNPDTTTFYDMDNIHYGFTLFSLAGPGSWTFFTNVLNEVMGLFPGKYIHCGGDEVVATGDSQWNSYTPDANQMSALGINTGGGSAARQQYQRWFTTISSRICKVMGERWAAGRRLKMRGPLPMRFCSSGRPIKGTSRLRTASQWWNVRTGSTITRSMALTTQIMNRISRWAETRDLRP